MGVPLDAGGGSESRLARLGRSVDMAARHGEGGTRSRADGSLVQGLLEAVRGCALRARAGVGAGGDDGRDSTAHSTGPCGSLGGNTCGRKRRIHSWAGRVMVCQRED